MNFSFERPSWMDNGTTGRTRRRMIAGVAAGAMVLAVGIPVANAAEGDPTLTLSTIDGLVVVQGTDFTGGSSVKLSAVVDGGSGAGTVTSKTDGTLAAAFEPPEGFSGRVAITAKAGSETATASITMTGTGTGSSDTSTDDATDGDVEDLPTTGDKSTSTTVVIDDPPASTDSEEVGDSGSSSGSSTSGSSSSKSTSKTSKSSSSSGSGSSSSSKKSGTSSGSYGS